jgi:DNA-binding SARP family transcriptional activator
MTSPSLTFRILGPLEVDRDGVPVRIAGQKPKSVLALLLLNPGRVVAAGELVRGIWGEDHTDRASATLQVHVSNLRKQFADATPAVLTQPPGYVLHASAAELDLPRFDELVRHSAEAARAGGLGDAEGLLADALALWRGQALADVDSAPAIDRSRTWLEDRRLGVVEDRFTLLLRLGQHRQVADEAEAWTAAHPLREPLWESLVVALYRSGRQADALAAYSRARARLLEDLGIEPGARLRALELAVLSQDASLDLVAVDGPVEADGPVSTVRVGNPAPGHLLLQDGTVVDISDRVTIGRHPECDITLADPSVSRHHAEVRPVVGGYLLVDTSSNGTRVGGEATVQRVLRDGDVIEVGGSTLTFRLDG